MYRYIQKSSKFCHYKRDAHELVASKKLGTVPKSTLCHRLVTSLRRESRASPAGLALKTRDAHVMINGNSLSG